MSSLITNSPTQAQPNLRSKVNQVKRLLDDANRRLQDEASKNNEIFTTKSSASSMATTKQQNGVSLKQQTNSVVPSDLRRTINDIGTIQSVLSCPIFNRIVNVTDSLDKLAYHLTLRPSIGPSDININDNGELILAPPFEPPTLNSFMNDQFDGRYSIDNAHSNLRQQQTFQQFNQQDFEQQHPISTVHLNTNTTKQLPYSTNKSFEQYEEQQEQPMSIVDESGQVNENYINSNAKHQHDVILSRDVTDFMQDIPNSITHTSVATDSDGTAATIPLRQPLANQSYNNVEEIGNFVPKSSKANNHLNQNIVPSQHQASSAYDSEKLVSSKNSTSRKISHTSETGNNNNIALQQTAIEQNGFGVERTRVKSVAAVFESVINNTNNANQRPLGHKVTNGSVAYNQMIANNNIEQMQSPLSSNMQIGNNEQCSQANSSQILGFSNELYHDAQSLNNNLIGNTQQQHHLSEYDPNHCTYANEEARKQASVALAQTTTQSAIASHHQQQHAPNERPSRASPSASAGSTVRLADECDSGTSSFISQAAKGTLYSPQSHKPIEQLDNDPIDSESIDQELIEKLSPEMERIKVTLEKGPEGIGITIAGYIVKPEGKPEEMTGIFIKGITPGSPADRCGKIKILDQIYAVNGQEILGYSNPEATHILRKQTGKVVTLELMRYLAESKYYGELQNNIDNAIPAPNLIKSNDFVGNSPSIDFDENHAIKSSLPQTQNISSKPLTQSNLNTQFANLNNNINPLLSNQSSSMQTKSQHQSQQQQSRKQATTEAIYKNSPSLDHDYESAKAVFVSGNTIGASQTGQHSPMPVAAQRYSGSSSSKVIETKQGARNTIDIRSPMCQTNATYVNKIIDSNDVFDSPTRNNPMCVSYNNPLIQQAPMELSRDSEPVWERDVEIVELQRDLSSQGLGFTVKEYNDPKDQKQSIIMITSITPGGIAEINGKLSLGDLLVFVDDKNLEGASLNEAVKALKETNGQVRLGVLKLRR